MVVLGVILLFLLCAIFLCCVRPRNGGEKKGLQVSQSFQVDLDHSHHTPSPKKQQQYSKLSEGSPKRAPVTGSWSPGDPYTVSVCVLLGCDSPLTLSQSPFRFLVFLSLPPSLLSLPPSLSLPLSLSLPPSLPLPNKE